MFSNQIEEFCWFADSCQRHGCKTQVLLVDSLWPRDQSIQYYQEIAEFQSPTEIHAKHGITAGVNELKSLAKNARHWV